MSSNDIQEDEFDANWVCCLLEDIPAAYGETLSLDSDIPWPASVLGDFPCCAFPWFVHFATRLRKYLAVIRVYQAHVCSLTL